MAHHCQAAIITCEDFRLHRREDGSDCLAEFLKVSGLSGDLITRAGGIQDLVRPQDGFDKSLLRDIAVSVNLHQAGQVYLINHQDCGAYGGFEFTSPAEEFERHKADLLAAAAIIKREFPAVTVKLYFAELADKEKGAFQIREVA